MSTCRSVECNDNTALLFAAVSSPPGIHKTQFREIISRQVKNRVTLSHQADINQIIDLHTMGMLKIAGRQLLSVKGMVLRLQVNEFEAAVAPQGWSPTILNPKLICAAIVASSLEAIITDSTLPISTTTEALMVRKPEIGPGIISTAVMI